MKTWGVMLFCTFILTICAGGANKLSSYILWLNDGHVAMEQAQDTLERLGVTGQVTLDSAPSMSRGAVAGHVVTDKGTLPFYVSFFGHGEHRIPVKVTIGERVLLPSPQGD